MINAFDINTMGYAMFHALLYKSIRSNCSVYTVTEPTEV